MITVVKLDPSGNEKIRYTGELLAQTRESLVLKAEWTLPSRDLGYTHFEPGDLFIEYYYTARWYNIFAITDRQGERKGWYCNITEPALIKGTTIEQVDLYLDVWISPTGTILQLDDDEFGAASLTAQQRTGAQQGLAHLLTLIEQRQEMFTELLAHH